MPVNIDWRADAVGECSSFSVPLMGAKLKLEMVGEVVVDASWQVSSDEGPVLGTLATAVKQYLLNPEQNQLNVILLKRGTEYSNTVWDALLTIPVGSAWTYSFLAETLGSGPRAVARACRDNPYAGIIPCHRVVAKKGIGGFMGEVGGEFVALKRRLLDYEAALGQKR